MITKHYFPTRIFIDMLDAETASRLNTALLKLVREDRQNDPRGLRRSSYAELGGWHSQAMLHKNPAYADLLAYVHRCGELISESSGYDPRYSLQVDTMWSIINPHGATNMAHIHPGSLWSGVYYIQAPKGCGNISFTDPRTANVMSAAIYNPDKPRIQETKTKITLTPEPGKIVIFPSWLYHAVAPNIAQGKDEEADRVIISFNINQRFIENNKV